MRDLTFFAMLAAMLACTGCTASAAAQEPKTMTLYEALGMKSPGLRGAALDKAVSAAAAFPLGSEQNPVRTRFGGGQGAYLARLRCSDGSAPQVLGRALGSPSPFGGVPDIYTVACPGGTPASATIAMDTYHEHVETRPVPGFTIVRR